LLNKKAGGHCPSAFLFLVKANGNAKTASYRIEWLKRPQAALSDAPLISSFVAANQMKNYWTLTVVVAASPSALPPGDPRAKR
jgi:hypothetical protein